jgi:beta-glucosidase
LYKNTLAEVKSGVIPMSRVDDAVTRILRVKMRLGMFEAGLPSGNPLAVDAANVVGSPAHRALARRAVRESLVLLKNDGVLPIDPRKHVLVAGDGADNISKQNGGWTLTWQGTGLTNADFPGATSIFAGIQAQVKAAGGSAELSVDGSYKHKPDVAIVVFGEDPYAEFQGDLPNLAYRPGNDHDLDLLRRLRAQGVPVVAVFLTGRPLWMNREINASDAFVVAWLPGSEGEGIADVLLRTRDGAIAHDFHGKLAYAWPRTAVQIPVAAAARGEQELGREADRRLARRRAAPERGRAPSRSSDRGDRLGVVHSDHLRSHEIVRIERADQRSLAIDDEQARDAMTLHQLGGGDGERVLAHELG